MVIKFYYLYMKNKKNNKNIKILLINLYILIILLFILLFTITFLFIYNRKDLLVNQIKYIDNIINGRDAPIETSGFFSIYENKDNNKNFDIIDSYVKNIYIPSTKFEKNLYFINKYNKKINFNLKKIINENPYLKIIFLDNKLNFIIPQQTFLINNIKIKTNEYNLFSFDGISKKSVIKINDNIFIDLNNYNNDSGIFFNELLDANINLYYLTSNYSNLKNNNLSFEEGLWTENVKDCKPNLPGEAQISMSLSNDATDGDHSLELSSKNHDACTNLTIPVKIDNDKLYKFSFDYKNIKGNKLYYYYNFHDGKKWNIYEGKIETENNEWNHFEDFPNITLSNIKNISIYLHSPSDSGEEVINLFDNFRLQKIAPNDMDSYYLYAHQEVDESPKLNNIEFKTINRFKNKVVLHGVKNSFLLAYPEEYNENIKVYPYKDKSTVSLANLSVPANYNVPEVESNRQATKDEINGFIASSSISATGLKFISKNFDGSIRNDNLSNPPVLASFFNKPINEDIHYQINNYSNAWWIDIDDICKNKKLCKENVDGTYDISLLVENKWNKILNITIFILGLLFLINLGYLIYYRFRRNDK